MDDPTKDTIPRSAVEYCLRKETVNTNPDAYEAHEKFIAYMDDPDISQFGHWMHSNGFNCALTTVKCDLDKIPSAQSEQRWIPCSERLPENDERVLATTAWGEVTIAERIYPPINDTCWFIDDGNTNATIDDVVAWMPLPEPYREEER